MVGLAGAPAEAWQASGTNGRIAWASKPAGGSFDVWTMNADGSDKRNITNSSDPDYQPEWSPDGKQIAYTRQVAGTPEIWVMNADGSTPHAVYTAAWAWKPTWSPDGTRIAFAAKTDPTNKSILAVVLSTGAVETILQGAQYNATDFDSFDWPSWSPAGPYVANEADNLYQGASLNSIGVKKIGATHYFCAGSAEAWHPAFSPDGGTVAFIDGGDIWFATFPNSFCTDPHNVTSDVASQGFVSWSPDGKRLIYSEGNAPNTKIVSRSIADPADRVELTDATAENNDPSWSNNQPAPPSPPTPGAPQGRTIIGTPKRDILQGTPGDDIIYGKAGNDKIYGNGGNDVIIGGKGNDKIFGGDGNDTLKGGPGRDRCDGGPGTDTAARTCERHPNVP